MKKLMIFVTMLLIAACTPMPVKASKASAPIESIIDMPGISKDQIYAGTKSWIAETFRSAKAVIQDDDKSAGRIIGTGRVKYPCSGFACMGKSDWTLDFTIRVDIKDQKMRVTFLNLGESFPPSPGYGLAGAENLPLRDSERDDVSPTLLKMQDDLKAFIETNKSGSNF